MAQFIGKIIDALLGPLASACVCYYLYQSPKATFTYRKKWILIVATFFIILGIYQYINTYQAFYNTRAPTANELKKAFTSNNSFAKEDILYQSPDGYSIIIPAGYSYTAQSLGMLRLTAKKGDSVFFLMKTQSSDPLEKIMKDSQNYLKNQNSTYIFSETTPIKLNDIAGLRTDVQVIKNNTPANGVFVIFKKDDGVYVLQFACLKESFEAMRAEFEKVINSFR
jgi:hypothetical protein